MKIIKRIFQDKSLEIDINADCKPTDDPEVLRDFFDRSIYQKNDALKDPECLKLEGYQDAF